MQFVVQLVDFQACFVESLFAGSGDFVESPLGSSGGVGLRFQQAGFFQSVQQRVESARADAVTVVGEFLHHCQAENGLMRGVQKHVEADQPGVEFALKMFGHNSI